VTGFYNCGSAAGSPVLVVSAGEDNSSTDVAAGTAVLPMTTCNGTDQSFSVTITSSNPGGSFAPEDPDVTITETPAETILGIGGVMAGTSILEYA